MVIHVTIKVYLFGKNPALSGQNTFPLTKTRSSTKKFSALSLENSKYWRFLNGFSLDRAGFFLKRYNIYSSSAFTASFSP